MRLIRHILAKDLRVLRWPLTWVAGWIALQAVNIITGQDLLLLGSSWRIIHLVILAGLSASIVLTDPPARGDAFWVVRAIPRDRLLLAKGVLLVTVVIVASIVHVAALRMSGLPAEATGLALVEAMLRASAAVAFGAAAASQVQAFFGVIAAMIGLFLAGSLWLAVDSWLNLDWHWLWQSSGVRASSVLVSLVVMTVGGVVIWVYQVMVGRSRRSLWMVAAVSVLYTLSFVTPWDFFAKEEVDLETLRLEVSAPRWGMSRTDDDAPRSFLVVDVAPVWKQDEEIGQGVDPEPGMREGLELLPLSIETELKLEDGSSVETRSIAESVVPCSTPEVAALIASGRVVKGVADPCGGIHSGLLVLWSDVWERRLAQAAPVHLRSTVRFEVVQRRVLDTVPALRSGNRATEKRYAWSDPIESYLAYAERQFKLLLRPTVSAWRRVGNGTSVVYHAGRGEVVILRRSGSANVGYSEIVAWGPRAMTPRKRLIFDRAPDWTQGRFGQPDSEWLAGAELVTFTHRSLGTIERTFELDALPVNVFGNSAR